MSELRQTGADALRRELRAYVEETFLYLHPGVELADGDELLELGVIDSLGFVELVEEVQARYGIVVGDVEITEENFGSIDALVAFVERRRGERT
jgi:acyl carrier protein